MTRSTASEPIASEPDPLQLYCEFEDLGFSSSLNGPYRMTIKTNKTTTLLWLQSKKTKKEWQCSVDNFANHMETAYHLPNKLILEALEAGLATIDCAKPVAMQDTGFPIVIALILSKDGTLTLGLQFQLFINWKVVCTFLMVPIEGNPVAVLEARLCNLEKTFQATLARICDLEAANGQLRMALCKLTVDANASGRLYDHYKGEEEQG